MKERRTEEEAEGGGAEQIKREDIKRGGEAKKEKARSKRGREEKSKTKTKTDRKKIRRGAQKDILTQKKNLLYRFE